MSNKIVNVERDVVADAVYIQLTTKHIVSTKELDNNRLIDYSDSGKPVGIDLLEVSKGVKLNDLPEAEAVKNVLASLGIRVYTVDKETQSFLAYAAERSQKDPDPEVREVCANLVEQLSEQVKGKL